MLNKFVGMDSRKKELHKEMYDCELETVKKRGEIKRLENERL
jgi:hypothetical protein